ncbi:hypothetical protein [Geobacter sp. DSM 9736]|uniref:hypothetical protein n=1 Tax=Geobacter sp. DSM 9736 TaxID=1277350 RepID=UPI000B501034|nr:hypothetical protein [Geobacter sp. DSM 9736]SNB46305.1 hypothetical protein SAMN06269301_1754 [Geobacter sp. DSM 9736]
MRELLPEGEDLRRAVKWVSENLKEDPDRLPGPLVRKAIFKFDLSPRDGEFLVRFFSGNNGEG